MESERLKGIIISILMLFFTGLFSYLDAFILSEIKNAYDPHSCSVKCFDSEFIDYHNETVVNELYNCLSDCRIIMNEGISPSLSVSYVNWVSALLVVAYGAIMLFLAYHLTYKGFEEETTSKITKELELNNKYKLVLSGNIDEFIEDNKNYNPILGVTFGRGKVGYKLIIKKVGEMKK